MQVIHIAVNWWYVALHEKYLEFKPPYGFLFIPDFAPVVAQSKALLAADYRVDMWLINVYRSFGPGRMVILLIPLLTLLILCVWRLWRSFQISEAAYTKGIELRFSFSPRYVISFLAILSICTLIPMTFDYQQPAIQKAPVRLEAPEGVSEEALMKDGLDALYNRKDYNGAAAQFRKVLKRNPNHYGANFQLAMALDRAGKKDEARPLWLKVLKMAEKYNDQTTADIAQKQLQMNP